MNVLFCLILDNGLPVGIQSAGDMVSETMGSNPAFIRGRQLVTFLFEYRLPVRGQTNTQGVNIITSLTRDKNAPFALVCALYNGFASLLVM